MTLIRPDQMQPSDTEDDVLTTVGGKSVWQAPSGSSLTTEEVQDIVGAMLTAGAGITGSYNDGAGTYTISVDVAAETERVVDALAAALTAGSNVTITYDDVAGTITIASSGGGGGFSVVDAKGDLIVGTANDTVGRLAVGAAGKVLVPDSSQSTGLKWSETLGLGADPPSPITLYVRRVGTDYAILALSTSGDSADVNIDKAIIVKHDVAYALTPGYAHTLQVYAEAGMHGLILGSNAYVGDGGGGPYAPTESETADGFVRFELGPYWPRSEVGRFNNQGDFIVGWSEVRKHTASQSGNTVTASIGSFTADDVGKFFCWGDLPSLSGGRMAFADRITGFTSSSVITVETSRTISSQKGRVCTALIRMTSTGDLIIATGDLSAGGDVDVAGSVTIDGDLIVTGSITGDVGSGTTGELLMQDGVTAPPVPLENEARDDWLYEG